MRRGGSRWHRRTRRLQRRPPRRHFGNGRISAYLQQPTGKWVYKGQVRSASGAPVVLDGLWAIAFGNGSAAGPSNNLYFAAGPTGQTHGLFGFIAAG
jgi:hypothetical protein